MFRKKIKKYILKKFPLSIIDEPGLFYGFKRKKILNLKDKYKGKRCFIVGNGPSLNKLDLGKLKNEYSFAVNGIFYKTKEMGYKPNFYVVEDKAVMNDNTKEINDYDCDYKFFPSIYKPKIKNRKNTFFFNMNRSFYNEKSPYFETPRFSLDCENRVYAGQSVTIDNLQLAYYLGFTEVYLIGMDFSYNIPESAKVDGHVIESTEDDVNHFHPDYFGKGKTWHDPKLHNVLKSYKLSKLMYEFDGRKIYNATYGGNLNIFDRVNYNELF
ncbi:6-hydroxymethylpterin diphosphokinase MptE-like protein [Tenacibaculum insulae]|uniref:6-hydroxymethylpterin diphosphokinase MptE-like protein n=1 Tax=Tenacibaculum insulae TaxID=2029677 RepID=UPI003AB2DFBB